MDWGERFSPEGGHFGLVHLDHTPKPSYAAYYTMVELLHDYTGIERLNLPGSLFGFDFSFKDGHKVRVLWSEKAPQYRDIPEGSRVIDLMGRELKSLDNRVLIDKTPHYIVGRWE